MRINLTKKDIINAIYMRIGFSKKISENLFDDIFDEITKSLIEHKKIKISKFGTFILKKKGVDLVSILKQEKKVLYQKEM